jgi:hypothetical protein
MFSALTASLLLGARSSFSLCSILYVSTYMVGILHVIQIIIRKIKCKILNIRIVVKIQSKIIVICC